MVTMEAASSCDGPIGLLLPCSSLQRWNLLLTSHVETQRRGDQPSWPWEQFSPPCPRAITGKLRRGQVFREDHCQGTKMESLVSSFPPPGHWRYQAALSTAGGDGEQRLHFSTNSRTSSSIVPHSLLALLKPCC